MARTDPQPQEDQPTLRGIYDDYVDPFAVASRRTSEVRTPKLKSQDHGNTAAPVVAGGRAPTRKNVRLQARDRLALEFIKRHRFPTYLQIEQGTGIAYAHLRKRFRLLADNGIITSHTHVQTKYLLWSLTDVGAAICELEPSKVIRKLPATIRHASWLIDLCTIFEQAGELVQTEREYAAELASLSAVRPGHSGFDPRRLYAADKKNLPDLVLWRAPIEGTPQSIAIELELKKKMRSRLRTKIYFYKHSPRFGLVCYYIPTAAIRDLVDESAIEMGATDVVLIRRFEPGPYSGIAPDWE